MKDLIEIAEVTAFDVDDYVDGTKAYVFREKELQAFATRIRNDALEEAAKKWEVVRDHNGYLVSMRLKEEV